MLHDYKKKALSKLPSNAPQSRKNLIDILASSIDEEDAGYFDAQLFSDMVQSQWQLCKTRKPSESKVSIYCPISENKTLRKTIIDIVSDDFAFIVDSIIAEVNRNNLLIDFLVHPVFFTEYDSSNKLQRIQTDHEEQLVRQSHIHIHIKETVSEEVLIELEKGLYEVLDDVKLVNRDWKPMLNHLSKARDELAHARTSTPAIQITQFCAFLDYLYDNNFTLLGYREYKFVEDKQGKLGSQTVSGSSLGFLSNEIKPAFINENKEGLPRNLQELRRNLPAVSVSKTNRLSTVHRRVPMDAIAIKTYNEKGKVTGEKLFLGLFTSVTYSRSVSDVPYLREKVEEVIAMSNFMKQSHDRKALRHILEKYPRDELFQIPHKELLDTCLNILRLQERQRVSLFMRKDPFGRYVSCLVYIPRDRFETSLRKAIGEILEDELNGKLTSFYTSLDDSVFARVMLTVNVDQNDPPKYSKKKIEKRIQEVSETWSERLADSLANYFEDYETIKRLTLKYGEAFSVSYTSNYSTRQSVFDIEKLEEVLKTGQLQLVLYKPENLGDKRLRLKIYSPENPINLSDVLPALEHMGLRAVSELPFEVTPDEENKSIWIHDFLLQTPETLDSTDVDEIKNTFEAAFIKIWYGEMESDSLNRLVINAQMNWRETVILRSYVRYMKQIGYAFGRLYVQRSLTENPHIARLLVDLFLARFDPEQKENRKQRMDRIQERIKNALSKVESLDYDRILQTIRNLIMATLRTNFFQTHENGEHKPYLSIKLESQKLQELPEPRPFREIFVYSSRVEGVHLRGDKIARGGIRWSDRNEDFRTEILGLMKAQMVKNSLIVPMGAKGGFVVKNDIKDRQAFKEEGIECYKLFIRGLLDITDNQQGHKVIPPENVVRHDEDDPYLVVAADKGTATFSDIANGISQEYGFWLGDAFASGGSAGYDHKKMGITARGAWESVKLHFRQLHHNTQTQEFEVVGVGDMSGDVFGNGMLLSEKIRLIGAFNHLHIFCDPSPDPDVSFRERKRLFDKALGWDEYDTKKLSGGGRIFKRSEKSLKLTDEIKKRFDIEDDHVSPSELIRAMLKSRTDLLWFGGIGTYIKSSLETHADVGDKSNEGIRINGDECRAKVIGEGANLGVTQRGRIEFALKGGKINTDFLDNSGGVDCSDHEVNIKILLSDVMSGKSSEMDLGARNKLLVEMSEEVAAHVLRNNYQQAQALSLIEMKAADNLQTHEDFIKQLEKKRGLNRKLEGLPDEDAIRDRQKANKGLTRPELCVLLSYAKIEFSKALLGCEVPDTPEMLGWIVNYFPAILNQKFHKNIKNHRLRREIIATAMANSLVNRMGPTFIETTMKKTGADCAEVAKAYLIVREAFSLRKLWDEIESLDNNVPAQVQLKAMQDIVSLAEHAVTWFLIGLGRAPDIAKDTAAFRAGIQTLTDKMGNLVTDNLKLSIDQRLQQGKANGLPEKLARNIAVLPVLASGCDIIRISLEEDVDLLQAARTYFELGEYFNYDWLRYQARFLHADNSWESEATEGIIDQLYNCQAELTLRVLKSADKNAKNIFEDWLKDHARYTNQLEPLFDELKCAGTIDLPMLIIAEQRLRALCSCP